MSWLRLERLSKLYGTAPVVDAMSLDVVQGEMVVLLGPSGCGKTTTLRMIAGFVQASSGDIALDGQSILRLPAHRREMGIVFQSYALFPHLSVARNVAFGLEMRREPRAAIAARVQDMLRLVQLEPLADRLPRELSGGQQQRVALARALAIRPKILLLDEPLSNLDAALRLEVGRDIRILQRDGGLTALMVTHDQDEAMAMADRLVVMKDGRVQQIGTQQDLYERPANPFVAAFIGRSNMLPGMQVDPTHMVLEGGVRVTFAGRYGGAGACTLALRPERLRLGQPGPARGGRPDVGWVDGTVELSTYLGAVLEHVVRVTPQLRLVVRGGSAGRPTLHPPGELVSVRWTADGERLFDAGEQQPLAPAGAARINTRITSDA